MAVSLALAALAGIAVVVGLILALKIHPFLALLSGSAVMALAAGIPYPHLLDSFTKGLGETMSGVGLLIVVGAVIGTLLVKSGGADVIVDTILAKTSVRRLPWAMALVAFIVGIPLFFEVGVIILIPVIMAAAKRAKVPVLLLGIPALAGLSTLHGLIPPHPGPLLAIDALQANLGLTLGLGMLVAVPCVTVAGPLLGGLLAKWVPIPPPERFLGVAHESGRRRPSFAVALIVVVLPVVLMLARTLAEVLRAATPLRGLLDFVGTPLIALIITAVVAMILLGYRLGGSLAEVSKTVGDSFAPIAGVLLIVGAGGGFKQTLVDSGIADVMASGIAQASVPAVLAGWVVAAVIRVATGSATVATITASSIMAPLAVGLSEPHTALLCLSIGGGSVFLSHVNDAGFWLVKEYFGMTVGQTFKTWSLMETVLSLTALAGVMGLSLVI